MRRTTSRTHDHFRFRPWRPFDVEALRGVASQDALCAATGLAPAREDDGAGRGPPTLAREGSNWPRRSPFFFATTPRPRFPNRSEDSPPNPRGLEAEDRRWGLMFPFRRSLCVVVYLVMEFAKMPPDQTHFDSHQGEEEEYP